MYNFGKHGKAVLFGMPAGHVGEGNFSVWIEHNDFRAPEAFGYETADQAFARVDELRAEHTKKIEAVKTLIGSELPPALRQELEDAVIPDFKVYRMTLVPRVDMSALPSLDK